MEEFHESVDDLRREALIDHAETSSAIGSRYTVSLISYLDVIGMKTLLASAGDDPTKVSKVLNMARRYSTPDKRVAQAYGWSIVNFSDLIVRAVPVNTLVNQQIGSGLAFQELFDLAFIQLNLLLNNVLIRGAVTLGRIAIQDGLVFGPALARAYLLESQHASFPRIIVDTVVLDGISQWDLLRAHAVEEEMAYIRSIITKDEDGMWFVDYLKHAKQNADNDQEYRDFLQHHRALVSQQVLAAVNLDGGTKEGRSRQQKAIWLKDYHNKHVRTIDAGLLLPK